MRKFYSRFFSPSESRRLLRLGGPIYMAQLASTGMSVVDTVMTGQASAVDMAAVAVASSILNPLMLFGVGLLHAMTPLCAQLVGEGRTWYIPHFIRQGIWTGCILALPIMLAFYAISGIMQSFGLEPHLASLAEGYLRAVLWGIPGFYLFIILRGMLEGFSRTRPAMVISFFALLLNIPLNYILIYGKFGAPTLGAVGCGVATAFCFWVMGLSMAYFVLRDRDINALGPLFKPLFFKNILSEQARQERAHARDEQSFARMDFREICRIFRIGFPGALALLFEISLFAVSALVLAPMGTVAVAGHQIAMNVGHVIFIIPLSLAFTCTIRVGYCLGARQFVHARLIAWTSICVGLFLAVLCAVGMYVFRHEIPYIYNDDSGVVTLAATLILLAAMYQIVDALQVVCLGILRGYNDTTYIFIMGFISYWMIGFPLGYMLSSTSWLVPAMGPVGFWIAFIVALTFGAVCYVLRVLHLHKLPTEVIWEKIHR